MNVAVIAEWFRDYVQAFPQEDMIKLKIDHTARVVANAHEILRREGASGQLLEAGLAAAWLHDVGRFKQFERYHTFSDLKSVNHALMSCAEILRLGWLDALEPSERNLILKAVEYHNLRALPPHLDDDEVFVAHVVRDADKLDIFTVLEEAIATDYLATHPEVYWGLPFTAPLSDAVVQAIEKGESVDYKSIRSFADFVFIQVAWCHGGLHFPSSSALALERQCVAIRRDYLCKILPESDHERIQYCCAIAENALMRKAHNGA